MKVALRLRLQCLGHLVEDVGGLVHPAPLLSGRGIELLEGGPEAQGFISDGQLRWLRKSPLSEIEEQLLPALLALTDAVHDGDQLLPAFGRGSHEDEQALLLVALVFQPHVHMDAVGPDVDVLLAGEVSTAPLLVLLTPILLETNDDVGAESLGVNAHQRLQGLGKSRPSRCP